MKTLLAGLIGLTTTAFAQIPPPPPLQEVLKRANPHVLVFTPVSMARGQTLHMTHVRMGDGSVKPGSAVQLVVYSSEADQQGNHEVLFQRSHLLSKEGSPVLHFDPFTVPADQFDVDGRQGIIAVLIGLLVPSQGTPTRPGVLPPLDVVSAQITDGTSNTLLLPAVQKVRSAAAR